MNTWVCVCVYMCVCVCARTRACMCAWMHACERVCEHTHTHTHMHVCVCVYILVCLCNVNQQILHNIQLTILYQTRQKNLVTDYAVSFECVEVLLSRQKCETIHSHAYSKHWSKVLNLLFQLASENKTESMRANYIERQSFTTCSHGRQCPEQTKQKAKEKVKTIKKKRSQDWNKIKNCFTPGVISMDKETSSASHHPCNIVNTVVQ